MLIYNTKKGILVEQETSFWLLDREWDELIMRDDLHDHILELVGTAGNRTGEGNSLPGPGPGKPEAAARPGRQEGVRACPATQASQILEQDLLPPVGKQEIWGAGVTYGRSREARKEESRDAGGGDFYQRVYEADRPEIFFKSNPGRCVGSGEGVRIRRDSTWNVPEPELTLVISPRAKIIGYTAGNDMSSRDIEGQNPLYLPQAKTYDGSASVGPGIWTDSSPIPPDTAIELLVSRDGKNVFGGKVSINRMKRKHTELVEYLFRECSFPDGCLLMTGTGIVPPNDFTLTPGDEIRISIPPIGTLVNYVT